MYLKEKNETEIIGNALEELYNNDFDYSKMSEDNLEKLLLKVADLRLKKLFDE
ncbi:hypothetical protein J6T66_01765 [bacterium]|nr:hypothetical protein [bacterium]